MTFLLIFNHDDGPMPHIICSDNVYKNCLKCDKCNDWIHYRCSNLPAYFIIQLSKSKRVFTCHSCVKLKCPLAFPKLHDDIVKIIMSPVNLPSSPLTPSAPASPPLLPSAPLIPISPLTPSAPLPPPSPFTPPARVRPGATQSPLAPLPPHTIQVPTNPLTLQPAPLANNKALNNQLATKSISSTSPKSCKFYMQGHCRYGKKALVALIHIPQCASSSLRVVIKDGRRRL